MKRSRFITVLLFAVTVLSSFGGPPTDQGFWTFFKNGVQDDLVLAGLGMHAGLRALVPCWALAEDLYNQEDVTEELAKEIYDAGGNTVEFLQTPQARKIVSRFAKIPKKGEGMKYVTKSAKNLFAIAKTLDKFTMGYDSGAELAKAKILGDAYLAAREIEYERMRLANAAKKTADESRRTTPDISTLERLVDEQVAYVRGLLASGRKATRAQFDEFNALSARYGKEFDRLKAEIFAMSDEARKRECLQRLMSINGRVGKELDPLLDQAERKGLFKNLSAVSSPSPKPVAKQEPTSDGGAAVAFAGSFFDAMKTAAFSKSASEEEKAVDGLGRFFVDGGWGSGSSGGERNGKGENARRNRNVAEQLLLGIVFSEGRISFSFSSGDERDRAAFAEKAREILPASDAALEGSVVWAKMSMPGMEDAGTSWVAMKLVGRGGGLAIQMLRMSERRDPLRIDWNPR